MSEENIKIGMKVVPFQKSAGERDYAIITEDYKMTRANEAAVFFRKNDYMIVNIILGANEALEERTYVLGSDTGGGDYFRFCDFYPFVPIDDNGNYLLEL